MSDRSTALTMDDKDHRPTQMKTIQSLSLKYTISLSFTEVTTREVFRVIVA